MQIRLTQGYMDYATESFENFKQTTYYSIIDTKKEKYKRKNNQQQCE